jgi:hypothetical protein
VHLLLVHKILVPVFMILPGPFMPGLVVLVALMFGRGPMRVRAGILQLGSSLVIFVMRSIVVASRHGIPRFQTFSCKRRAVTSFI